MQPAELSWNAVFSRQPYNGFSLVELLVALSLLSLVLIGGFASFNMIEANYARESGHARQSRIIAIEASRLFHSMQDNSSFSARLVPSWPLFGEAQGLISISPLWDNASMLNHDGGFICRISTVDPSAVSFGVPAGCLDHSGVSENALNEMIELDLPSALIMDAQEPCIPVEVERSGVIMTFTVLREACLRTSTGEVIYASARDGSGVIFPRFLIETNSSTSSTKHAFFDHPGGAKEGASLNFGQDSSPDGSLFTIRSSLPGDDFTQHWVNIHHFGNNRALALIHSSQLSSFTLKVEILSRDSHVASSSAGSDASRRIYRQFNSSSALENFLYDLHLRSLSSIAELRFHLGAGKSIWVRDLRLEMRQDP